MSTVCICLKAYHVFRQDLNPRIIKIYCRQLNGLMLNRINPRLKMDAASVRNCLPSSENGEKKLWAHLMTITINPTVKIEIIVNYGYIFMTFLHPNLSECAPFILIYFIHSLCFKTIWWFLWVVFIHLAIYF